MSSWLLFIILVIQTPEGELIERRMNFNSYPGEEFCLDKMDDTEQSLMTQLNEKYYGNGIIIGFSVGCEKQIKMTPLNPNY